MSLLQVSFWVGSPEGLEEGRSLGSLEARLWEMDVKEIWGDGFQPSPPPGLEHCKWGRGRSEPRSQNNDELAPGRAEGLGVQMVSRSGAREGGILEGSELTRSDWHFLVLRVPLTIYECIRHKTSPSKPPGYLFWR